MRREHEARLHQARCRAELSVLRSRLRLRIDQGAGWREAHLESGDLPPLKRADLSEVAQSMERLKLKRYGPDEVAGYSPVMFTSQRPVTVEGDLGYAAEQRLEWISLVESERCAVEDMKLTGTLDQARAEAAFWELQQQIRQKLRTEDQPEPEREWITAEIAAKRLSVTVKTFNDDYAPKLMRIAGAVLKSIETPTIEGQTDYCPYAGRGDVLTPTLRHRTFQPRLYDYRELGRVVQVKRSRAKSAMRGNGRNQVRSASGRFGAKA